MAKQSAGTLLYRFEKSALQVFLVHPGGPFWHGKDLGAWSIPKGEYEQGHDALAAAKREFTEETGFPFPPGELHPLGEARLPSRKRITAWALHGDCDAAAIHSNTFSLEWPPRSGKKRDFPEVDRAAWFDLATARQKIHPAQQVFLDRLIPIIGETSE